MQLRITNPVPVPEVPKDSYIVEIETVQGDGDGYRNFTVGPFKKNQDEASLQSLLETLHRMDQKFPHGMGGDDKYDDVLGYDEWFAAVSSLESLTKYSPQLLERDGVEVHEQLLELAKNHSSEWSRDSMKNYEGDERLRSYTVFYYDEAGTKYNVEGGRG